MNHFQTFTFTLQILTFSSTNGHDCVAYPIVFVCDFNVHVLAIIIIIHVMCDVLWPVIKLAKPVATTEIFPILAGLGIIF